MYTLGEVEKNVTQGNTLAYYYSYLSMTKKKNVLNFHSRRLFRARTMQPNATSGVNAIKLFCL
jgi:hypothetical protein